MRYTPPRTVLDMSHRTIAAVRQNEMKVNITRLTTTTCAARVTGRLAGTSCGSIALVRYLTQGLPQSLANR
jgi:hypothetical protein